MTKNKPSKKPAWKQVARVYGCVTNNKEFWIGFISTFFYNYSEIQSITLTHNQSSAEPFFLDRKGLAPFSSSQSQSHIATDGQSVSQ
jgi:hypothetical protein